MTDFTIDTLIIPAADGRTVEQAGLIHKRADGQPQLASPTGFGSVPLKSAETRFLLNRGFELQQVERLSVLTLPLDDAQVDDALTQATVEAGDDYRVVSPRTIITTVVEHAPTGVLAGFTELSVPPEIERPVEQRDTLVLREHRGHRLGMLLKLSNLQYVAQTYPGHPSVNTFNAEVNRPMLDVNEAIGFVAVGYGGAWKKVVMRAP